MGSKVSKSISFATASIIVTYFVQTSLQINSYVSDVGGLGVFATIFGTLYGIMSAFVVFEVWAQYNLISSLVDKEALGLERLFRLTIYFRDKKLTDKMKDVIEEYIHLITKGKFKALAEGQRNLETSRAFRKISQVIKDIKFDDDHDQTVFSEIIKHYGSVHEMRTERINQSLNRLPHLLKLFLYITSSIVIITFIVMPFNNTLYALFSVGSLAFIISMLVQIIEDLDNPFVGHWNITPESFERVLKHIEEDY